MSRPVLPPAAVDYPTSDGKRLAENDAQARAILYAFGALRVYFEARSDVYVSADLLIYYEEGNPRVSVAPDVFVVFGVEDRMRRNYKVWEEGKGPDFVLEVASPGTWREDVGPKRSTYARLGVREYFLYDPTGEHLTPRLQGHRLEAGVYERLSAVESIDRTLDRCRSEVLGLELRAKVGRRDALSRPGDGRGPSQSRRRARRTAGGSDRTAGRRGPGREGSGRKTNSQRYEPQGRRTRGGRPKRASPSSRRASAESMDD